MRNLSCIAILALAALMPLSANAQAGAAPVAADAPDAGRMALARQVVAIVMPPDQTEAMVSRMMDALTGPMLANAGAKFDSDPGLKTIWTGFTGELVATARESVRSMIPQMRDTYVIVYARHFTSDELSQILAFGKTPTGAKYLSRSSELLQDSNMKTLMAQSMNQTTARMQPVIESFKAKMTAYLEAHPDVAKKMSQGQ